ncbi:unnamed protein product [Paramecium primaurelia]|uniref:Uncharacterized protein n=1 Tax=Paramecium primaurelia TaxID=5886 RepID=A0A8S1KHL8_PARPR|nr:unnamed protein product [Paramecium primaurelia]
MDTNLQIVELYFIETIDSKSVSANEISILLVEGNKKSQVEKINVQREINRQFINHKQVE